jgi:hypothetical protein
MEFSLPLREWNDYCIKIGLLQLERGLIGKNIITLGIKFK